MWNKEGCYVVNSEMLDIIVATSSLILWDVVISAEQQ